MATLGFHQSKSPREHVGAMVYIWRCGEVAAFLYNKAQARPANDLEEDCIILDAAVAAFAATHKEVHYADFLVTLSVHPFASHLL